MVWACQNVSSDHTIAWCYIPPGGGRGLIFVLFNGGSYSDLSGFGAPTFSYTPPTITSWSVVPYSAPTNITGAAFGLFAPISGSFRVVIRGESLTLKPTVQLNDLACGVVTASHTMVRRPW